MPFTLSHPAAIIPFKYLPKKWISATGLVIGSVVPDFEYFIRMQVKSIYSHTWLGMLWFNLPLGLILAFVYHGIVKKPFIQNLPGVLKIRFSRYTQFNWNSYFLKNMHIVVISLLVGTATHLFWDSFTHPFGYFVRLIPALRTKVVLLNLQVPVYKIFQHASTVVGGVVVLYFIWKMPTGHSVPPTKNISGFWAGVLVIAMVGVLIKKLLLQNHSPSDVPITLISGTIMGIIVMSLFYRKRIELNQ